MKTFYFFILFLSSFTLFSQENLSPDKFAFMIPDSICENPECLALHIRSEYPENKDFVRALYVWTTKNIYFSRKIVDSLKNEDLISYAFKTKTGKCKNYSAIITGLCNAVGIEAYSILGYVKINRKIETSKDHAWNIIKIDDKFYLFDPTWDASSKENIDNSTDFVFNYYMKDPDFFIKTHMPYDPMMQLSYYPIRHKDFFKNKTKGKKYFNYKNALKNYNLLNEKEQLRILLTRAEGNGLTYKKLKFLRERLIYFVQKQTSYIN